MFPLLNSNGKTWQFVRLLSRSLWKIPSARCQSSLRHLRDPNCKCSRSLIQQKRLFGDSKKSSEFLCELLIHRNLVKISGRDTFGFLQGLVTNDVHPLETAADPSALYAMILNVQGRVLYDIILYRILLAIEPTVLVECNSDVTSQLIRSLEKYKLRKKLQLSDAENEFQVSSVFKRDLETALELPPLRLQDKTLVTVLMPDPRLKTFAYRLVTPFGVKAEEAIANCETVPQGSAYNLCRYQIGLSEGTLDLPPGNCLPLESNLVFLNGVAFDKGCYIGQELTARTHHTGVIRKRLMPIILSSENVTVKTGAVVEDSTGKVCGKVRNVIGKHGLALLRLDEAIGKQTRLFIKGEGDDIVTEAKTFIPNWWNVDTDEVLKQIKTKKQEADELKKPSK